MDAGVFLGAIMNVTINGETVALPDGCTVSDALRAQGLDPARVVVERNRVVLPANTFDATVLADGDTLEVLHFVGGG